MKTGVGASLWKMFKNKSGCRGKCRLSKEYIISLLTSGLLSRGVGPRVRPNGAVLATMEQRLMEILKNTQQQQTTTKPMEKQQKASIDCCLNVSVNSCCHCCCHCCYCHCCYCHCYCQFTVLYIFPSTVTITTITTK